MVNAMLEFCLKMSFHRKNAWLCMDLTVCASQPCWWMNCCLFNLYIFLYENTYKCFFFRLIKDAMFINGGKWEHQFFIHLNFLLLMLATKELFNLICYSFRIFVQVIYTFIVLPLSLWHFVGAGVRMDE
jgi:hypothetical protein